MKAVVFDRFGPPEEVLQVRDLPVPQPQPGQVRVRMLASPVNPSDIHHIKGEYGQPPKLPATPGFEGVGIVEASGGGILGWRVKGRRVAVLNSAGGNWSEQVVIPSRQAVPLPDALSTDQAATFFVNPASALVMIRHVLRVPPGAWVLQTGANGALGRIVIRLGKRYGFRTINAVRRPDQVQQLNSLGADAVICSPDGALFDKVQEITQGTGAPFGLDPIGGALGAEVLRCLAPGGRLLVYGTLSGEPICLSARVLMAGPKSVEGFWLSEWTRRQSALKMLRLFHQVRRLFDEGIAATDVAQAYPLEQVREAVRHAQAPGRNGKVLLRIGS